VVAEEKRMARHAKTKKKGVAMAKCAINWGSAHYAELLHRHLHLELLPV
jgi:hypothetical protein